MCIAGFQGTVNQDIVFLRYLSLFNLVTAVFTEELKNANCEALQTSATRILVFPETTWKIYLARVHIFILGVSVNCMRLESL